ncbi:putative ankyrin repeat protein [Cotonvirus japonicus]|uniref:Ankyrin repeat protein n=1 Tax=Cotonvirus japonicus TaxID=2811091 RepID=A0ABM7NTT0_9VIRU|nr:putative ankyrin repeat protein [Cotonvirus japonicus]BCS83564.1 putative ankyrin repeat protein [Cotonvirus japonicus]
MQTEKKFFKILKSNKCHNGYRYKKGLNVINNFQEHGSCVPGRLYFSEAKDICRYLNYGEILVEVFLPTDDPEFKMVLDPSGGKYGANKIVLGDEYDLSDPKTFKFMNECGIDIDKNQVLIWSLENKYVEVFKYLTERIILNSKHVEIILKYIQKYAGKKFYDEKYIEDKYHYEISVLAEVLRNFSGKFTLETNKIFKNFLYSEFINDKILKELLHVNATSLDILLFIAMKLKDFDYAKTLISNGADFSADNHNALIIAVENDNMDFIEYLISLGENISARDNFAIVHACRHRNLNNIKKFMSLGANIQNDVFVMEHIAHVDYDYLDHLISLGSKTITKPDYIYITVTSYKTEISLKIIKCLQKYGYPIEGCRNEALLKAASTNNLNLVKFWYENGADLNSLSNIFSSDFSINQEEIFKFLLDKNITLNVDHIYIMNRYISKGDIKMVQFLMEKGYDLSLVNYGDIKSCIFGDHINMIKFLVKNGVNLSENNGEILKYAELIKKEKIVEYLKSLWYFHSE